MTVKVLGKNIEITDKTALKAYALINGGEPNENGVLCVLLSALNSWNNDEVCAFVETHDEKTISEYFTTGAKIELRNFAGNDDVWNEIKAGVYKW